MLQPSYCCPTTRMSSHKQVVKSHSSYVRNSKIKWKRRVVEINWVSAEKTLHTSFSVWQEALKKNQIRKPHASIMAKSLNQNAFNKLICVAFLPIHALLYTAQVPPLLSWQHQWLLLWCPSGFTLRAVKQTSSSMPHQQGAGICQRSWLSTASHLAL